MLFTSLTPIRKFNYFDFEQDQKIAIHVQDTFLIIG